MRASAGAAFVICILVITSVFAGAPELSAGVLQAPDFAGTWNLYLRDGGNTALATITIDARGVVTGGSSTNSSGSPITIVGGSLAIGADGLATGFLAFADGSGLTLASVALDSTQTIGAGLVSRPSAPPALALLVRAGAQPPPGDLSGAWRLYLEGGSQLAIVSFTVDADGLLTGVVRDDDGTVASLVDATLGATQTVGVGLTTRSAAGPALALLVRAGALPAISDLAGTWRLYTDGHPHAALATITVDARGAVTSGSRSGSVGAAAIVVGGFLARKADGQLSGFLSYADGTTTTLASVALDASHSMGVGLMSEPAASPALTLLVRAAWRPRPSLTVEKTGSGSGRVSSTPEGIACGRKCTAGFAVGSEVRLTATAAAGSVFAGWTGGGCTGTGQCTVTLTEDLTITAEFRSAVSLAVVRTGAGTGKVTSSPAGIDCGRVCSASVPRDTPVTLTATPAPGAVFVGWTGGGCAGTGVCTVSPSDSTTILAEFAEAPFTLTVTKAGSGSGKVTSSPAGIDCGTTCAADFESGTLVTLTEVPDSGSVFGGWVGCAPQGANQCTLTVSGPSLVTATFKAFYPLKVKKTGTGGGLVTSSPAGINCGTTCEVSFVDGDSVTLTATANPSSVFVGWSGGGCSGTAPCTVALTAATTVTAKFLLTFTDPALAPGSLIKAVDVSELRTAVNAVRVAQGLSAFVFTDPTLTPGVTTAKAVHLEELRTALDAAYVAASLASPTYTDAPVTAGVTPIKAVHLTELRAFAEALP